jgi:hypothetical protein
MNIKNGFIVDVSSFCDRWCARCVLTTRCELFVKCDSDRVSITADSRLSLLEQVEMLHDFARHVEGVEPGLSPAPKKDCHLPGDLEPAPMGPSPEVVKNSQVLHRKRQRARLFVRPGFDEMTEVRLLDSEGCMH